MEKSNMTIKTAYDIKEIQFDRNFEVMFTLYCHLPQYINRSTTKYFPIETIPETTYSTIRNLEEVEYDTQISLRYQETHVRQLVVNHVKVPKIHWSPFGRNFAI